MWPRLWMTVLALGFVLLCGCSSFKEQYIFRAGRPGDANYYRVTIKGRTFFTSSQFAAGLYDAEAVDALFGELTGPGKRVTIDSGPRGQQQQQQSSGEDAALTMVSTTANAKDGGAETVGGKSLKDQKFVFFLSSNADFFVNQIQTYVTTERMQTAVVTLLLKDDLQRLELAKIDGTAADARAKTLADSCTAPPRASATEKAKTPRTSVVLHSTSSRSSPGARTLRVLLHS